MKITIYELLGMVKDGKIPKKIKYDNDIWEYIEEKENYIKSNGASLNWDYVALYCLKEPVEILEEPKGAPEKIEPLQKDYMTLYDIKFTFSNSEMIIVDKINEIIDYLESKGDE